MRRLLRILIGLLLATLLVASVAALVWREQTVAQWRALVVVSQLLEVPVAQPVVRMLTPEPRDPYELELDGIEASVFRPAGEGPWPAIALLTGADGEGRRQPDLVRAARALARAGFVVYAPDTPGLREGRLGQRTIDDTASVLLAAAGHRHARGRRVGVVSVSAGASLALVAAGEQGLEGRVSVLVAVAPFADPRTVAMLATTGHYTTAQGAIEPFDASPRLADLLAESVLDSADGLGVPPGLLERVREDVRTSDDPLAPFRELRETPDLPGEVRAVLDLVANRDPARFDALYDAVPDEMRSRLEALSPVRAAPGVEAPVELLAPPLDPYFPLAESELLERRLPDARLTVTPLLQHAIPENSGSVRDLVEFDAAVVRALNAADG